MIAFIASPPGSPHIERAQHLARHLWRVRGWVCVAPGDKPRVVREKAHTALLAGARLVVLLRDDGTPDEDVGAIAQMWRGEPDAPECRTWLAWADDLDIERHTTPLDWERLTEAPTRTRMTPATAYAVRLAEDHGWYADHQPFGALFRAARVLPADVDWSRWLVTLAEGIIRLALPITMREVARTAPTEQAAVLHYMARQCEADPCPETATAAAVALDGEGGAAYGALRIAELIGEVYTYPQPLTPLAAYIFASRTARCVGEMMCLDDDESNEATLRAAIRAAVVAHRFHWRDAHTQETT